MPASSRLSNAPIAPELIRAVLLEARDAAAAITLPLFRTPLNIDNKLSDGFDPVTEADKGAEREIRAIIEKHFPDHEIIGEEYGRKQTGSPFSWVIDPIDGTRAFMSGLPLWGTLIALTFEGRAIAGMMSQPFIGETYLGLDNQTHWLRGDEQKSLRVSAVTALSNAVMYTTTPALFSGSGQRAAYDAVEEKVKLARYGSDCYAYGLLASGHVDLIIEPGMQTYDIAALVPIIENAGGVVSTWSGDRPEAGGNIIAAATPELRDAALEIMRQHTAL